MSGQFIKPDNSSPSLHSKDLVMIVATKTDMLPPSESEAGRVQHTFVGEAPKIRWSGE